MPPGAVLDVGWYRDDTKETSVSDVLGLAQRKAARCVLLGAGAGRVRGQLVLVQLGLG